MSARAFIAASLLILNALAVGAVESADWPTYLGDRANSHYSPLKQINTRNVNKLQIAWTYSAGGARPDGRSQIQCNPLIIDGVLYGTSPQSVLFALDAATGKELWRFNPLRGGGDHQALGVNRGVVYWADGRTGEFSTVPGNISTRSMRGTGKSFPPSAPKGA
jgi:quinoprotein glucose dehydrogenase